MTSYNAGYTTTTTWSVWCDSTGSSTTSTAGTWSVWNDATNSTATAYDYVWYTWTSDSATSVKAKYQYQPIQFQQPAPTKEELEKRERVAQEFIERQSREREERERLRKEAEERSRELLEDMLDDEQKQQLEKDHSFLVSVKSGRKYRIRKGITHNIDVLEGDKKVEELCVYAGGVPEYDNMAAQLLWLLWNEEALRKKANIRYLKAA
jgi:hypothetical protein